MKLTKTIILSLALIVVIALNGCVIDFGFNLADYRYKYEDFFEADLEGADQIALKIINGKIEVDTWEMDRVEIVIHERIKASNEEDAEELARAVTLKGDLAGSTLRVELDYGDFYNMRKRYACNLEVRLPSRMRLKLETTNGAIDIDRMDSDVIARTTNGSIIVESAGGDAELHTTNGSITAYDISGKLEASSTNGALKLYAINNSVYGSTTNGKIVTVVEEVLKGDIDLSSTNGSISLEVHPESRFFIRASTSNGSIRDSLDGGDFDYNRRKTRMSGTYKNDDNRVTLDTTNGGIRIESK